MGCCRSVGKPGINLGFDIYRPLFALRTWTRMEFVVFGDAHAHLKQLGGERLHVRGNTAVDGHIPTGRGSGNH